MKIKSLSKFFPMAYSSSMLFLCILFAGALVASAASNTINANPSNYLQLLRNLRPGDTLLLEPGVYNDPSDVPGLPIFNLHGEPGKLIVITGPESGPRPILEGRSTHNTIRIDDASYVVVRNIEIDGRDLGGDGVKAQGISHHITLENLYIYGVGRDKDLAGVSTNGALTWNWIIRNCVITNAGTGMYLGNSDGNEQFINGVIEHNLIIDTIGYNLQIKHQNPRPDIPGMPTNKCSTIIRHNVFSKAQNGSSRNPRPNVLVGHWPLSGPGSDDIYLIYGNFFFQNPHEVLFQGEGNIALYNNLFFNEHETAISIQAHNDVPRMIRIFFNTVVAKDQGISITGADPAFQQTVSANAVFAASAIRADDQENNVSDAFQAAGNYLVNPTTPIAELDLYPKPGMLSGTAINTSPFASFLDWNMDFNGKLRTDIFRGAYDGEGQNPGWQPKLERKPPAVENNTPPTPPRNLRIIDKRLV